MIDLSDVTFLMPVRIDSVERLENFIIVVSYLIEKFETNIMILEDDGHQNISFDTPPRGIRYAFQQNEDPLFHKTRLINRLAGEAATSIVALHDCDVLFPLNQYVQSAESIRSGSSDCCLAYDGRYYEIPAFFRAKVLRTLAAGDINIQDCRLRNIRSVKGCVFCNKDSFFRGGMANENLKSWGYEDDYLLERFDFEDTELIERFRKLGFRVKGVGGGLFHLEHPGGVNHPFCEENYEEFRKILSMSRSDLEGYVETWKWAQDKAPIR